MRWYEWLMVWLGVGLDQGSKYLVNQHLVTYESVAVVPGLNITLTHNKGAAFSFLANQSGWQQWLFLVVALLISIYILSELKKKQVLRSGIDRFALMMVLSGAWGNCIDRIGQGQVTDFIDLYAGVYHWPTFNVADTLISIGVVMLIFSYIAMNDKFKHSDE